VRLAQEKTGVGSRDKFTTIVINVVAGASTLFDTDVEPPERVPILPLHFTFCCLAVLFCCCCPAEC